MTNPPAIALRLQRRALAVVLVPLGVDTIAWPLADLIRQYDAPHAFYLFAQQLGLDGDVLLFDQDLRGAEQRIQFRESNELLLVAESLCVGTRLSPELIALTLQGGPAQTYHLMKVLEEATAVDRQLQALSGHKWKSAQRYEARAAEALLDWSQSAPSTLASITESIYVFRELERSARDAADAINQLTGRAKNRRIDSTMADTIAAIVEQAKEIERTIALQPDSPHDLVSELFRLQEELEVLLDTTHEHHTNESASDVQSALDVFDLDESATFEEITAAYRKLAKQYHPDHNANREDAMQSMQEINAARDTLRHHFARMTPI